MRKALAAVCISMVLALGFSNISNACTLIGSTGKATEDGNAYMASTSCNPYIQGPRKPVYVTIPEKGYKFVHTPCLIQDPPGHFFDVGSDRGMNEKGFSWTRSWVVPNEPEAPDKLSGVEWFLKMGSTVATVDEAIRFVKENPKGIGCQGNYIFADAEGNMALVEVGYQTVHVVGRWSKDEKGIAARANRWESNKMKLIDISKEKNLCYYETSSYRYERANELLNRFSGKIDVNAMKEMIGDNENREASPTTCHGKSISAHGQTDGTVSSEVYDPANLTFWYTYGWPDGDYESSNPAVDGANKNTWGAWIPFILPKLKEEGFYTDWYGNMTPTGARYLSTLVKK